jgi:hypothetical protein
MCENVMIKGFARDNQTWTERVDARSDAANQWNVLSGPLYRVVDNQIRERCRNEADCLPCILPGLMAHFVHVEDKMGRCPGDSCK